MGKLIISSGRTPGTLAKIVAGEPVGTLFLAQGQLIAARKRWIGFTAQPKGRLVLDEGACRAVGEHGRSLLAAGIVKAVGRFAKGDIIALCDLNGVEFARGLTNYSSEDILRIRGLKTGEIAVALGHCPYDEVVHRNNLALTA